MMSTTFAKDLLISLQAHWHVRRFMSGLASFLCSGHTRKRYRVTCDIYLIQVPSSDAYAVFTGRIQS